MSWYCPYHLTASALDYYTYHLELLKPQRDDAVHVCVPLTPLPSPHPDVF